MPPASTRSTMDGGASDAAAATATDAAAIVVPLAPGSSSPSPSPLPPTTPGGATGDDAAAPARRKRPSKSAASGAAAAASASPALDAVGFSSVAVTGSLTRARPAFNAQGDVVACANGTMVVLLAAGTGEVLARLLGGHTRPVSCLAFGGAGGRHLFTAGLDGVLRCWEVQGGQAPCILHTHRFEREVLLLSPSHTDSKILYLALGEQIATGAAAGAATDKEGEATAKKGGGKGSGKYRVIEYALANGGKRSKVLSLRGPPLFLEASRDGQFVVAACATRLCVWSARERELWTAVAFDDKKPREGSLLQAVALNPAKAEVATGDVNGRVYLWPTLFHKLGTGLAQQQARRLTKEAAVKQQAARRLFRAEVRRWHAHGVTSLAFSPDGHYLLSGGPEAVLVLCQLARGNHTMTFLPRLGAPVASLALSGDGLRCAVTTAANALLLVRPMDLTVPWRHQSLAHPPEHDDASALSQLWAAPPSAARVSGVQLVGNSLPGKLQLFDASTGVVRAEVEAVPSNVAVSSRTVGVAHQPPGQGDLVVPACVAHAAMAGDGKVVVTVERRVGEEGLQRTSLKFWERDAGARRRRAQGVGGASGQYGLAAVVDRPHESQVQGRLLSLAYHPTLDLVASTSAGGAFSLWARVGTEDEEGDGHGEAEGDGQQRGRGRWVCQATVPFKRGPARCAAFAPDGSLLAVGCGPALALWDPLAVRLLTVLADPRASSSSPSSSSSSGDDNDVAAVHFLPNTPRLACATRRAVVVWDLLSLAPVQRYEAGPKGQWAHLTALGAGATLALAADGLPVHFAAVLVQPPQQGSGGGGAGKGERRTQTVVAFNAGRPQPLLTYPVPSTAPPILSLALAEGTSAGADDGGEEGGGGGASGGLYYLTREGVTLLAPAAVCQRLHRQRRPAGAGGGVKRGGAAAGVVAAEELQMGRRTKRARLNGNGAGAAAAERGAEGQAATVAELLGTTTGLLPPPSAVFDAFLAGLLPTRLAPPVEVVKPQHEQQQGKGKGGGSAPSKKQQQPTQEEASNAPGDAATSAFASFPAPLPTVGMRQDLMRLWQEDFARLHEQQQQEEVVVVEEGITMNGGVEKTPSSSSSSKKSKARRASSSSSSSSSTKKQKQKK